MKGFLFLAVIPLSVTYTFHERIAFLWKNNSKFLNLQILFNGKLVHHIKCSSIRKKNCQIKYTERKSLNLLKLETIKMAIKKERWSRLVSQFLQVTHNLVKWICTGHTQLSKIQTISDISYPRNYMWTI